VRNADELVFEAERADDFGRAGKKRNNPHRLSLFRIRNSRPLLV
jgi:hypothetical protein